MRDQIRTLEIRIMLAAERLMERGMKKEPGLDGILVTVGLCIIALLLCIVMKNSMTTFINQIILSMTEEARKILTGVRQ